MIANYSTLSINSLCMQFNDVNSQIRNQGLDFLQTDLTRKSPSLKNPNFIRGIASKSKVNKSSNVKNFINFIVDSPGCVSLLISTILRQLY